MKTFVFIGAGNVATNIALTLKKKGFAISQVYSRTEKSAKTLSTQLNCDYTANYQSVKNDADIYFYCLPDNVLQTCQPIKTTENALHIHTAGSVSQDIFKGEVNNYGVLYPFQTFSKTRLIDFTNVPILVQANSDSALRQIKELANLLSSTVVESTDEKRMRLHLAGVIANNFTNCLYGLAFEQMQKADLPHDWLLPLIDETAKKVHAMTPVEAQTGPAKRRDSNIISKHRQLLSDNPQVLSIYNQLTEMIQNYCK